MRKKSLKMSESFQMYEAKFYKDLVSIVREVFEDVSPRDIEDIINGGPLKSIFDKVRSEPSPQSKLREIWENILSWIRGISSNRRYSFSPQVGGSSILSESQVGSSFFTKLRGLPVTSVIAVDFPEYVGDNLVSIKVAPLRYPYSMTEEEFNLFFRMAKSKGMVVSAQYSACVGYSDLYFDPIKLAKSLSVSFKSKSKVDDGNVMVVRGDTVFGNDNLPLLLFLPSHIVEGKNEGDISIKTIYNNAIGEEIDLSMNAVKGDNILIRI